MQLKITHPGGTYTHDANEVSLSIVSSKPRGEGILEVSRNVIWQIEGTLHGTDQNNLKTKLALLETAYASDGLDAILFHNDGTTQSAHKLVSADTIGGVTTSGVFYPFGSGAEYTTFRNFRVTLEAEYPNAALTPGTILFWQETVSNTGGGPRFAMIELLNGLPVRQVTQDATTFRALQQGRAIGYQLYPTPPDPLWPFDEEIPERVISRHYPVERGRGASRTLTEYTVDWRYQFASAFPLTYNGIFRPL